MTPRQQSVKIISCGIALCAFLLAVFLGSGGVAMPETVLLMRDAERLRAEFATLEDKAVAMDAKVKALKAEIVDLNTAYAKLNTSYNDAGLAAGGTALTGPGVEIKLSDATRERMEAEGQGFDINWFLVHDRDVLMVINLLKAEGAEAVAVNGVRLTPTTAIHCGGPAIYVRDIPLTPPFLIAAIGDPDKLSSTILGTPGGQPDVVYLELMANGIVFEIRKSSEIRIPAADTAKAAISAAH